VIDHAPSLGAPWSTAMKHSVTNNISTLQLKPAASLPTPQECSIMTGERNVLATSLYPMSK
jgi:hypothetical protein